MWARLVKTHLRHHQSFGQQLPLSLAWAPYVVDCHLCCHKVGRRARPSPLAKRGLPYLPELACDRLVRKAVNQPSIIGEPPTV
jgi:hypothetical protein